ncbi:MAG: hypothetical protein ACYYK0_01070 [Candidatus Eutrophobiaceae bacterium]
MRSSKAWLRITKIRPIPKACFHSITAHRLAGGFLVEIAGRLIGKHHCGLWISVRQSPPVGASQSRFPRSMLDAFSKPILTNHSLGSLLRASRLATL